MTATLPVQLAPVTAPPRIVVREPQPSRIRRSIAPLSVGLFALALSLVTIAVPSVWYDEAATITSASRSWQQLWAEVGNVDAVHALYYAGMHVVFDLFGYSPFTLRAPSAVAIGIAAAFVVVLGRQLGRERMAIIAGLTFSLLPRVTWASGEGRSYAATATAAIVLTVLFVHALKAGSRRAWVAYGAMVVLSCVLFIYLALIVLAHAITIARLIATRPARRVWPWRTAAWQPWLVATASAGLLLVPFAFFSLAQKSQINWIDPLSLLTVRQVFLDQWFFTSVPFAIAGWIGIIAGTALIVRSRGRDRRAGVLVPLVFVPTAALLVASALAFPVYTPRYLSMCLPFVAVVIAIAIDAVRMRGAAIVALSLVALLALPQIISQRVPEAKEYSSWAGVAGYLTEQRAAAGPDSTAAIVYGTVQRHPTASARVMAYAYPEAFAGTVDLTIGTPAAETGELWETRRALAAVVPTLRLQQADVVYLITSKSRDQRPAVTQILASKGWTLSAAKSLSEVNVLTYERR